MRITVAAAALALAVSAAAQDVTLRMHHFAPPHAPAHALLAAPWAAKLEKDSGGRLRIAISSALQSGGAGAQLVQQLAQDEADIVLTMPAFTPGRFPRTEVFELPLLHGNALASTFALQDYYDQHLQNEYRDYHVLLLYVHEGATLHLKRPVERLEDFKALKIRAPGRAGSVLLRAVGATAVGSPAAELPRMLAKGLLDGALAPFAALAEYDPHTLLKHHVGLDALGGASVLALLMRRNAYDELPAELRRLVDAHSRRHLAWYAGKTWNELEAPGIAAAKAADHGLARLSSAETARMRAALEPELARFLAELSRQHGFEAAALYHEAKTMIARYTNK